MKIKKIKGIVTFKDELKTYLRKDGSGNVLICNFYIGDLRFTCFSDILFDDFEVGKKTHFEYEEKIDGRFIDRKVIRICDDKIIELKPKTMKKIRKVIATLERSK